MNTLSPLAICPRVVTQAVSLRDDEGAQTNSLRYEGLKYLRVAA